MHKKFSFEFFIVYTKGLGRRVRMDQREVALSVQGERINDIKVYDVKLK